ncbi:MAG TPA: GatB/YqeY domain-containing protein [Bacteroidales bacterium]|nr:GatB/YqeY domain-containing protein [Bacteroidales bacterium]HOE03709.1 GatB/YqeY domain-containing protein [Bacteroidales bacterium]HQL69463.1 GatB/YqeY domain-containing protein [Bacteroidales bacterium]
MSIAEQINEDIKKAMLAKDKVRLMALRAVKSAFLLVNTEAGDKGLTDERAMGIIQKMVKQRRETAEIYKSQNRADLYENEIAEAEVIATYLPKALSPEEIEVVVKNIVAETGATSIKDMGKVMGLANKELAGKADGRTVSEIVKKLLS